MSETETTALPMPDAKEPVSALAEQFAKEVLDKAGFELINQTKYSANLYHVKNKQSEDTGYVDMLVNDKGVHFYQVKVEHIGSIPIKDNTNDSKEESQPASPVSETQGQPVQG